jgi:hypothetical protein
MMPCLTAASYPLQQIYLLKKQPECELHKLDVKNEAILNP